MSIWLWIIIAIVVALIAYFAYNWWNSPAMAGEVSEAKDDAEKYGDEVDDKGW